ncbi:hypothetical protein C0J52_19898, partial [Blattella germanica]
LLLTIESGEFFDLSPKRKRNDAGHKRNIIKNAIVKGLAYVNHGGRQTDARNVGEDCRKKCFEGISEEERNTIWTQFHDLENKNAQDLYLCGLIEAIPVKQRRSRESEGKEGTQHSSSFRYFIMCGSQKKVVCLKPFRSLHAVGMKRVYNITRTLLRGEIPSGLAPASSHYASKEIHNLDARLTELYCVKYPDSTVKYDYYREYFRQNYAYRFGRPQIDTCSLCEELKAKLKSPHINENAQRVGRAELEVHLRRSRKFCKSLNEHSSVSQIEHIRSIAFDFMQNLPLPNIPVQETFYLRQLWVNVFNVHDLQTGRSVVYLYHEKGANEVSSYVQHYIPQSINELNLFSDGVVQTAFFINSPMKHTFHLGKPLLTPLSTIPQEKAYYDGKVPINAKKNQDIQKLVKYVEGILKWPTQDTVAI